MPNPEAEKTLRAQSLAHGYLTDFHEWRKDTGQSHTVNLPTQVNRVLIPPRLLELSSNPDNVGVVTIPDTQSVVYTFFEHFPEAVSEKSAFETAVADNKRLKPQYDPYNNTEAPIGVDYMHLRFAKDVEKGLVTLNDKILLWYSMKTTEGYPHVAETVNLFDRPEMRGQGIASSFYTRLEGVLKSLEFEFLAGQIWSPNPGFFSKTRKPYEDFEGSDKKRLPPHFASISPSGYKTDWMIKKL